MPKHKALFCSVCNVNAEIIKKKGDIDSLRCLVCGIEVNFDEAVRLASKYLNNEITDKSLRTLAKSFPDTPIAHYVANSMSNLPSPPSFVFIIESFSLRVSS